MRTRILAVIPIFLILGCAGAPSAPVENLTKTRADLQIELQRFQQKLMSRVQNAMLDLERSPDPRVSTEAKLRVLLCASSTLEILLGPSPESNLFQMIAYIEESRGAWKRNSTMSGALKQASEEIWKIAATVLNEKQKRQLRRLLKD